jgi:hypothetical protein
VAYRSRSRPSSTLGAKASTVCPYYLDGDLAQHGRARLPCLLRGAAHVVDRAGPGDTRYSAAAYRWRLMWLLCSFQGPLESHSPAWARQLRARRLDVATASCPGKQAGLSKLNSMSGAFVDRVPGEFSPVGEANSLGRAERRSGSVDMLGPTARSPPDRRRLSRSRPPDGRCDRGT